MPVRLAALIMARDEEESILATLRSVLKIVDVLVYFDTGSIDQTIALVKDFAATHAKEIEFRYGHSHFKDFATTRNESIKFAESFPAITHVLVLDAGDEVNSFVTKQQIYAVIERNDDQKAFTVQKKWKHGNDHTVFNLPLLFKLRVGCRYLYPVHEYLDVPGLESPLYSLDPSHFFVFQDRNVHGASSPNRWKRDLHILVAEHQKKPFDPRIQFYLAQTFKCLKDNTNAAKYYKLRFDNKTGFWEERFQSALSLGEIYSSDFYDENFSFNVLPWYMKALAIEMRVEPLLKIADHFIQTHNWPLAYMFVSHAVSLPETTSNLFVSKGDYSYMRYHKMGLVAYYVGQYEAGRDACLKAIEQHHHDIDVHNLKFYTDKLHRAPPSDTDHPLKISDPVIKDTEKIRADPDLSDHFANLIV